MDKKKLTYLLLILEIPAALYIGISSCIEGQLLSFKIISILLLIFSFLGIYNLFRHNFSKSKNNLIDLAFSLIIVFINHKAQGLVFGWEQCPII